MVSAERTGTFAASPREPIAPWWHTVLVVVPIAIGSIASWYQHGLPNANLLGTSSRLSSYFTVLVIEWFPVLLIWLALRGRGLSIGTLVSGCWQTLGRFFRDLALAVGFLIVVVPLVGILASLLGGTAESTVANITPKTGFELLVWLGVAATGGFCEELVFRGYLTQQFSAWTGSRVLALVLQGVAFGLAHGYYHWVMVCKTPSAVWFRFSLKVESDAHLCMQLDSLIFQTGPLDYGLCRD